MIFQTAVISQKGGRSINEDSADFKQCEGYRCWVVADGLGGHSAGELASSLAVESIISEFRLSPGMSDKAIYQYLQKAQATLQRYQRKNPKLADMRTTVVLMTSDDNTVRWGHVGDSRFYIFNSNKATFQTKDHSVPQALVNSGQCVENDIRFHEDRNKLIRVLGMDWEEPKFDISSEGYKLQPGDAFLLCTDGFWEYVTEEEMEESLVKSKSPKKWLNRMSKRILKKAVNDNDNYTAIAVFVK